MDFKSFLDKDSVQVLPKEGTKEEVKKEEVKSVRLAKDLTIREYFAIKALQGVEASNFENECQSMTESAEGVAGRAVRLADALIAELEKTKEVANAEDFVL